MPSLLKFTTGAFLGLSIGLSVSLYSDEYSERWTREHDWELLQDIIESVETYYVTEVDRQALVEYAIEGVFKQLDSHSEFLNEDEFSQISESNAGSYYGFGIEIAIVDEQVTIIAPIDDSPAFYSGIRSGDKVTQVDELTVEPDNFEDVLTYIREQSQSNRPIALSVSNPMGNAEHKLTPASIQVQSVKLAELNNNLSYLRISSFQEDTAERTREYLEQLPTTSRGLIIDLRNNPGGLLDQAIDVADMFLSKGRIVGTMGRYFDANTDYYASEQTVIDDLPIVVLINRGSASASEILAAALADNHRATLVGETSFGKASVQSLIPTLRAGTAIKLTTARYFTPDGKNIHKVGISPDIEAAEHEQHQQVKLANEHGLNLHKDDKFAHLSTDPDMALATDWLLNKRTASETQITTTTSYSP
ncbi:S41 family peptidase [Paraferrimonas sedimenticola]|uniref:Carboxyl-terminal processing protease n=1 Tax=Paraferrimonas sedimenticola TaxID=375674 RepID=A0AA37RYZ9_9GAMM|nr:S41 family peptidase [Paraferrimonas sedimenticola]GLP97771.1 carboxyl-terminal processing protease [Paraferrimonas sedimenticola]